MKYYLNLFLLIFTAASLYSDTSSELLVFTQKGCSRCEYTLEFLKKKGIRYTECPTEDEAMDKKMWSMIEHTAKSEITRITMPVIIKDGTAYYSIKDLEAFLEKLAAE